MKLSAAKEIIKKLEEENDALRRENDALRRENRFLMYMGQHPPSLVLRYYGDRLSCDPFGSGPHSYVLTHREEGKIKSYAFPSFRDREDLILLKDACDKLMHMKPEESVGCARFT